MTADEQWHEWRAKGIGGSDVAGILGISPWQSPYSVWADKLGMTPRGEPNEWMEFGKRAEAMIGPWFHDVTGLYVVGEQTWCQHPASPWARCTVDGFVAKAENPSPDEMDGVLEIKTTGSPAPWDVVPAYYQAQAQWILFVTGYARVHFAVLHGRRFRTYILDRDEADIDFIAERVGRFWREHVIAANPPVADGSTATADALNAIYPTDQGTAVEVDPQLVADVITTRAAKTAADKAEKHAANLLKAAMGENTTATVEGAPAATWKAQERRGVDIEAMEADHLAIVEQYRTLTVSRVLRITAPKGS